MQQQSTTEWRASYLIGTNVQGPNDQMIGEVEDVLIDSKGGINAVVVSVGGFLGVGEKNVAVPFTALDIKRQANDDDIERITMNFTATSSRTHQCSGSSVIRMEAPRCAEQDLAKP